MTLLRWKAVLDFKETVTGEGLDSLEDIRGERIVTYLEVLGAEGQAVLGVGIDGHAFYRDGGEIKQDDVLLHPESLREAVALKCARIVYRIEARAVINTGEKSYRGQQISLEQIFTVRSGDEFKFSVGFRVDAETGIVERITQVPEKNWLGGKI
jgi:hypothetical protein